MLIAGLDCETTGTDPATCHLVEVALVVVKANTTRPLHTLSYLLYDEARMGKEPMEPHVTEVNGITNEQLQKYGAPLEQGLSMVVNILKHFQVDYLVGHNAYKYDRPVLERHHEGFMGMKWVDTMIDVDWPTKNSRRLSYLAADHGFVNPWAHSGVGDVLTMLRLLAEHDFAEVAKNAAEPTVTVIAKVSYDDREKARARGYFWSPPEKAWRKRLKANRVEQEKAEAPFPVQVVV